MAEKINYDEYFYLDKDFREMVRNKKVLESTLQKFLDNIIDDITLGIIFEVHRKNKTRGLDPELDLSTTHIVAGVEDIHGLDSLKKVVDNCNCPNCDRNVSANRFASHLENCMGLGRRKNPTRSAGQGVSNNSNSNNSSNSNTSAKDKDDDASEDGDDDVEWNSRQKARKRKGNKSKKGKGNTRKGSSVLSDMDSVNVDVEGDDYGDVMLRDIMQDNSNQSSPAESVASSNASKKRDKSGKSKKNKRDRTSPNNLK